MIIVYPIIFIGYYLFVDDFYNFLTSGTLYIIVPFFLIIDILPTLVLHFQYFSENYNSILEIDKKSQLIKYSSYKQTILLPIGDIKRLIYINNYGSGTGFYSFAGYNFFKIIFKDGTMINITCLMMKNIKDILPSLLGIELERQTQFLVLINSKIV